ncbi:MAG: metallophosphoesterase, partial [Clostridia bacterium]|nr:metallophosphoesterase [Clostridia bacterium]
VIYIDKNKAGFPQTFMGDVNIILDGTTVEQFSNANTPIISGTLSVIRNNGATLPAAPAISCPTYDITSGDGVKVSLTGEKGVFAVECDGIAYVQSADGRKIYYGKETLDLAPGAYTVYTAEDIDAIIENANDPIIPDAYKHSGWDASVDGVLSAIIEYEGNGEPAYFVMNGGTGDGLSPNSPVGSVADVINVINAAGYDADDEVTVFIMDACEEPYKYDKFGNSVLGVSFFNKDVYTRATTWRNGYGDTSSWKCHLNFKAYDYELTGKNIHLMWMPVYGQDTNLTFHGDATFNNINFINTRLWDREFFVNGYDVCFNDCVFYNLKTDKHSNQGAYKGEVVSNHPKFMLSGAEGLGGVLNINSPFDTEGKYGVHFAGSGSAAYTNHVTVNLADPDINTGIYWGSNISSFADGLSLFMNGGTVREMDATGGSVTIGNGFEIVANADNTIFDMSLPENVAISGGIWNIKVNGDDMVLAPSGKTGTYLVTGDNIVAKATNEETGAVYFSYESTLTLPEGTYTVDSFLESELEDVKVDIYFDNDHASGAHYVGYVVHLPVLEDRVEEFFAGWDLETIDGNITRYNGGETFEIPEGESELYFYSAWEPYEDTVVIYLDQENGDDENEGSLFDPVKSIDKAFALAEASECATKKVAVVGRYGFGDQESFPAHTAHIILSGDDSGEAVFDINDDCARVNGPLTIENIKLDQSTAAGGKAMCAGTNELIFGKGLTVDSKFTLRLGDFRSHEGPVKASFFSGNFPQVEVGHFWGYTRGTVDSAEILVDGANIATLSFNSNGWLDTQMGVDYTGPVSITINSGSVGSVIATTSAEDSTKYAEFKDTFTMVLNNGCTTKFDDGISAANGVYVLTVEQEEGSYLEITDVPGKFKVVGAKTAVATNKENGAQFASEDGFITVSAGQYNVEFTDKLYYTNSGEKIRIYNECTLDLATIHHNEPAGKLFLGWTYEDGTTCGATFDGKPGDVLVARYVDYSASRDFSIIGAQIRTQGVQGLRFVVEKKNDFFNALPDVSEFGTIVLPTDATWGRDMFIDQPQVAEWKWDSETRLVFTPKSNNGYTPAKVVGEKIFKETDDSVQYTLCITNITEDKYYRFYSVKGYIVYKDYNGLEQVLYTDYYQTNLYRIALAALKAGEASAETFEGIKEYVEVDRKAAYMAENYDTRQLLTGYPTTEDKDPNHAMYRLANGMKIREVEIDTGIGGDEIEIVHFADTHLNYINRMDMEIGETNTLSTYRGRSWLRDGSSVPNINRAMEYASFFDKTVITGDIMDYFSWGCAEVMTKTIIDRSNKVVMALGNHEPAELCQPDMNDLSYKYSLDHTYQVLQSIWKTNDIYYHSEILTNDEGTEKVMIVLLDNQRDAYWGDIQAVPFAADIEKAREKGIPILIFEHNPISTQNPNETAATWFFEPGDLSGIPCDMTKSFAGSPAHGYADTMKVYNLIVRNSDVIKGVFCGHWHNHMYTEILAQNEDGSFKTDENGNYVVIPQHTVTANAYGSGNAIKITIK